MKKLSIIFSRIKKDLNDYKTAILAIIIYSIIIRKLFHTACPFVIITGFPCAGCGMTRALNGMITLNFKQALALNPAAPLWLSFILWFALRRYLIGKHNQKKTTVFLVIICIITLIIYIYRMLTQFPATPPMEYYPDNLINIILSVK